MIDPSESGPEEPSRARIAANRYVEAINSGDVQRMESLFAPRAVLRHPIGTYEGRDAVVGFYRDVVFKFETELTVVSAIADGEVCVLECEGRSPQGTEDQVQRACDVFAVDSGGAIAELRIYYS